MWRPVTCSFVVSCIWRWFLSPQYWLSPTGLHCGTTPKNTTSPYRCRTSNAIQGDSRGKVNIIGGHSTGSCEKKIHINVCVILFAYRHKAVWISRHNPVIFSFVRLNKERSLEEKGSSWLSCCGCGVRYVRHIIT
jgi:hypothetical protein